MKRKYEENKKMKVILVKILKERIQGLDEDMGRIFSFYKEVELLISPQVGMILIIPSKFSRKNDGDHFKIEQVQQNLVDGSIKVYHWRKVPHNVFDNISHISAKDDWYTDAELPKLSSKNKKFLNKYYSEATFK